ncbi:hypothetical protein FQA39_LY02635 [Lamprigera yunnana]|nr:hypothetical protein FQA39_LY02635 [Lamprigera yunnana]
MEKWISLLSVLILLHPTINNQNNYGCSYETLLTSEKQIICVNISSSFFQYFAINFNKSHWFTCKTCNLSSITSSTFNFPKNSINRLILSENNIIEVNEKSFAKLPFLKTLILRGNLIDRINIDTFDGIPKLLQLDLSKNVLEYLEEFTFSKLEDLDLLNLNHNLIEAISKDAFYGLQNLKYLYFNGNKITNLEGNVFEKLINLKLLYLEHNRITTINYLAFHGLENLNYLYLNNNTITTLTQYNFKPLRNLVDLQLRHNKLISLGTSVFNGLRNLKFLYLGANDLNTIEQYGLVGLNCLQVLDFIGNKLENFSLSYFKDVDTINVLWLENNNLRNFTIDPQAKVQKSLKIINLETNNLQFVNYKFLHEKAPQLEELWIGGNNWTCDFILEMYDYFHGKDVKICTMENCSKSTIKSYMESICFEPYQNETEMSDVAFDCTNRNNCTIFFVILIVISNYFYLSLS